MRLTGNDLARCVAIILREASVNVDISVPEVLDGRTVNLRASEIKCDAHTRRPSDTMSSAVCLTMLSVMLHWVDFY